jgi:alpha-L-fucosidase
MKRIFFIAAIFVVLTSTSCSEKINVPEPYGAIPTERQLVQHEMEFYGFIHFTTNTFTGVEWGFGDESPEIFNPSNLDCMQWAKVAKDAGMKGLILTAKHHDGFCLWPSEYTEHSVKNSPWKNGKGDVLKEFSEACKKYDLKMGLYLSPWDRNSAVYGDTAYITYYRNQLREILTNYGDVYEIWFDGANGGDGYYGGANEKRNIDNRTYYDWQTTRQIVRDLQPNAIMFSDAGPDIRWVGNEHGFANEMNWCTLNADKFYPGSPYYTELTMGNENGTDWVPAECDVSIRPGWFYHKEEDSKVKSVENLMEIYYKSIGRNGNFLLNLPPDRTGQINEYDVKRLQEFKKILSAEFPKNLAEGKKVVASTERGKSKLYSGDKTTDKNKETYWSTNDDVLSGTLTIALGETQEVNRIVIQEYIRLGQRVKTFNIEALVNDKWQIVAVGSTIGYKRILTFNTIATTKIRVNILQSKACPLISNIELYRAPDAGRVVINKMEQVREEH